jgi:UDP-N-acetylmuramate: L-alanyl-gamma-D-glutamyl-meso-diaminopimelate ligase
VEEEKRDDLYHQPYQVPVHSIYNNQTSLTIEGESTPLKVFGNHNLLNLHAAWLVCKSLNISAKAFITGL